MNDGYNTGRDRSDTGGERDRLVKQDGESFRYTDDVMADPETAADKQQWQAPDGGWAYVVMISAFLISFIVDGITYTFGILLADLEEAFQAPKSQITLAGSVQVGVYLMMGPIASAFTNAYGCRAVIIAGSLIAAAAYLISMWTSHIYVLIIVYGLIGGIGYGLMYLPSIVAVSIYFDRKRTLATCIALCGTGVGTLVMAPVTEFLLSEFNWRWTLFLQAGIILQGLVLGAVVRPLYFDDVVEDEGEEERRVAERARPSKGDEEQEFEVIEIREIKHLEESGDGEQDGRAGGAHVKQEGPQASNEVYQRRRKSSLSGRRRSSADDGHWLVIGRRIRRPPNVEQGSSGNLSRWRAIWEAIPGITLTNHDEKWTVVLQEMQRLKEKAEMEENKRRRRGSGQVVKFPSTPDIPEAEASSENSTTSASAQENAEERFIQSEPLPRSRAHTTGDSRRSKGLGTRWHTPLSHSRLPVGLSFISLADLQLSQSLEEAKAHVLARSLNNDPPESVSEVTCGSCWAKMGESFGEAMAQMLNCSILKNKMFWFVLLGNLCVSLGIYVPFVYISDRAVDAGIDETQAAFLVSIMGAANMIGRAGTGVVMQGKEVNTVLVTGLALLVAGTAVAACPIVNSYWMLALSAGLFGLFSAVFIALCAVLLCDILGVNSLANAFGFVIMFRGVAAMLGPPISGAIIDATGRFQEAFFLAGLMILLGGVSHLLLYIIYLSPCRRCFGVRGQKVTYLDDPGTEAGVRGREDTAIDRV